MVLRRIPIPRAIVLEDEGRRVALEWGDGSRTVWSAFDLRASCPCAMCVDEMTGRRVLQPDDVPPEVSVTGSARVGRYGVRFTFSDGHGTGIYTYEDLSAHGSPPEDPGNGDETRSQEGETS